MHTFELLALLNEAPSISLVGTGLGRELEAIKGAMSALGAEFVWGGETVDLPHAEELARGLELKAIESKLLELRTPASENEIRSHLADTIGCYPAGKPINPEVYTDVMFREVRAANPTSGAVQIGCQTVRRTQKFLPSVAEVVAAIEAAERVLAAHLELAQQLPMRLQRARAAAIAYENNMLKRIEQNRLIEDERLLKLEQERADIRRRLAAGESCREFHFSLVADVKFEMLKEKGTILAEISDQCGSITK
jgi:hypothetical protein